MYYIVLLLLCIPEIFLTWKKDNSLSKYLLKGCQVKKSGIHYETVFIILFLNARGKIYLTKVKCTRCKSCKITTMEVRECEKRIQKVEQSILTKNTLLMVKKKKGHKFLPEHTLLCNLTWLLFPSFPHAFEDMGWPDNFSQSVQLLSRVWLLTTCSNLKIDRGTTTWLRHLQLPPSVCCGPETTM